MPSFREGQRVWHKDRPAIFRYYMRDGAAVVRFEGRSEPSVVSMALLSSSPPDAEAA